MWKYIFGTKHIIGGSYSPSEGHKHFYRTTYPWFYWKLWIPTIRVGRRTSKGMYLQYNSRFWMFFWKPLCDGYYDSNVWHKSKQFQYLTFSLGSIEPKKRKQHE